VLPTHLSYDAPWPVRKVPLRCTPHFATYHLESKTYCVVTSLAEPTNKYYKFNGEDKVTVFSALSNLPPPSHPTFSVLTPSLKELVVSDHISVAENIVINNIIICILPIICTLAFTKKPYLLLYKKIKYSNYN
jgi:hypothetical protein